MKKIYFSIIALCVVASSAWAVEFSITVPEGAQLFVREKTSHYKLFNEETTANISTSDGKTTYMFDLTGEQYSYHYRVSQEGKVTRAGLFYPSNSTGLEVTAEMLEGNPKAIDRDVQSNAGYNVADIFLNINPQGHLKLTNGATHQLVGLRTWQATNSTVGNYFIEPDFHYSVVNENGLLDDKVVTVSNSGLLQAVGAGTAIVLVTYDALNFTDGAGGPFFGAIWPENTGVFVVSVDANDAGISSNITINENWNTVETNKMATTAVDAELDIFYYPEETEGYDYTFTPTGVTAVELAQPTLGENSLSYSGFSARGVTDNGDGSYTVRLTHGRNIVKLTSAAGAEYQVFSAKPVSYIISNATREGSPFQAGDKISILFNTLYHPCNKLAGVYNMSAGIQYQGAGTDFPVILGPGQYTFASRAQTYEITIPENYTESSFPLIKGVIKVRGYGDHYGNHRFITLEGGKAPNMNALIRDAYFGALPDIIIPIGTSTSTALIAGSEIAVYPNPFAEYLIVNSKAKSAISIYNLAGQCVLTQSLEEGENRISTTNLNTGFYAVKCGDVVTKIVKR